VYAHYLVPLIAVAALARNPRLERLVVWLSIGGLAAYGVELLALTFGNAWLGSPGAMLTGSVVLLGPAAVALLVERLRPPRQRHGVALRSSEGQ
jgi:hypothetical protein